MGSRIRDNVRHFFECFCEVVPRSSNKEPWIIQKFPEGYSDQEVLKSVTSFAYPCEFENTSIQHYSFVLTNIDSKWTFGFCRHDHKTETALVVLSFLPWHSAFYQFLNNIAVLTQSPKSEELWDFLTAAYNAPVPDPGLTYQVKFNKGMNTFTCQAPSLFQLPSIPENKNLTEYYNAVDSHNMMVIFASMLYERRIIFTSKKLNRLSACVQSANDIIYPMIWQHIFIPVLPMTLKDYLLAPMPFLIGVPDSVLKMVRKSDIGEVVILDADNNSVETPFDDLESLPQEIVNSLKRQLKNRSALLGDGVSRAFLRALVQLIGGYRDALRFQQGEKITFNPEAFIESRSPSMQPFLRKMLQLQIFQQFIEDRLQMLNSGLGFSDEFECEACNYSEKSSSKLKQQYREFIKNVKDKANPAVKSAVKSVKESGKGMRSAYKGLRSKFKENQNSDDNDSSAPPYTKPRSAPNSPTSSQRKSITKTYRKVPLYGLKPPGELRNSSYSPLSPPSNPTSPDTSENDHIQSFAPINMDLLREMQEVLNQRQLNIPPVDRSLKPVRSLENFKQETVDQSSNSTDRWWGPSTNGDKTSNSAFSAFNARSKSPFTSSESKSRFGPESSSLTQNLLDSLDTPNSTFFDPPLVDVFETPSSSANSRLFGANLLKKKQSSNNLLDSSPDDDDVFENPMKNGKMVETDLFGSTPFVVSGVKSENGDSVFLVASPNSVDMVKLSPPPTIAFTAPTNKKPNPTEDLIRLDSTPSSDSIDDFDPLLSKHKTSPPVQPPPKPEVGLSNPLYSYFEPLQLEKKNIVSPYKKPGSFSQTSSTATNAAVSNDQDLLQEYGIDFNKFNIQNGENNKNKFFANDNQFDPFDVVADKPSQSIAMNQSQWAKFD